MYQFVQQRGNIMKFLNGIGDKIAAGAKTAQDRASGIASKAGSAIAEMGDTAQGKIGDVQNRMRRAADAAAREMKSDD